jgi:hypothetical protein
MDLDAAGGQGAHDEGGQEGADPHGNGDPDALEDVESQMHSAVPWTAVTIDERPA